MTPGVGFLLNAATHPSTMVSTRGCVLFRMTKNQELGLSASTEPAEMGRNAAGALTFAVTSNLPIVGPEPFNVLSR